ncbi:MAG: endonuclease VIII [Arenicellales bacterium]|jgi:endonuclease-8
MPEGPEVRREADMIARAIQGHALTDVYFGLPRLKRHRKSLVGATITKVTTRGKALLIFFDTGGVLYSHNQLYGRWYIAAAGSQPGTNRTLRVALTTASKSALLYSASDISLLHAEEVERHPYIMKLGPDVLSEGLSWRDIGHQLLSKPFAGRSLSALYLDQSFVAGLGNYLRSEILFAAGVNPKARPNTLERRKVNELARATLMLSVRSYKSGGVTNDAATVKTLKKLGATKSRYRFAVFGRDGEPCYRCGDIIERETANGRRVYVCPSCQRV